jgi:hypothetical protein
MLPEAIPLPDWIRFEANSRIGFVTMDIRDRAALIAWAKALGNNNNPARYLYPDEGVVRYILRWQDDMSGWRFDLNANVEMPRGMVVNDAMADALEALDQAAD